MSRRIDSRLGACSGFSDTLLAAAFHTTVYRGALTAGTFIGALAMAALLQTTPVQTAAAGAASCESLSALALPNTTITAAQTVDAGAFRPPAVGRAGAGGRRGARVRVEPERQQADEPQRVEPGRPADVAARGKRMRRCRRSVEWPRR